ncbi:MAG: cyclic peptide export ABC transporter [Candidatus Aminicenantes bacterium]|nr:MAG: cyclic peptide export ABC transporter [Candidatus Aminicenantes bacterium]
MKKRIRHFSPLVVWIFVFILCLSVSLSAKKRETRDFSISEIKETVSKLMKEGDIPGLSLVILRPSRPDFIEGFGYANLEKETEVTPDTLFEIGSCSKSFTALAALKLEAEGLLNLDNSVSKYLPWFYVTYEGKKVEITVRQVLHHTSGIPFNSIVRIPMGDDENALEQTVKNIVGIELFALPGKQYQYATVNYDIVGLIIAEATKMSYEEYMEKHIFQPLGLSATTVGMARVNPAAADKKSTGYKISFFEPRKYDAPAYRGNSPAGYIVTNARDMARWLKLQLGLVESALTPLIRKSHQRDELVPPHPQTMTSYAMGWQVSLAGDGEIGHGGDNPNYTAYMAFRPKGKIGVAVLANSRSNYTFFIGSTVMDMLHGEGMNEAAVPGGGFDNTTSMLTIVLGIVLGIIGIYILYIVIELLMRRRELDRFSWLKLGKMTGVLIFLAPFVFGIYLLPIVLLNLPFKLSMTPWDFAIVWTPASFRTAITLLMVVFAAGYFAYIISSLFPQKNKYLKNLPLLIILSMLSGGANAVIIFLISGSLFSPIKLGYMLYFFLLAMGLYLLGRKVVQTKLTQLTFDIVYDMRMNLIEKIFYTSYQKFEKMDRGRVFSTLNDDTGQVGNSANIFVTLLTSMITTFGVFLYLSTIAFWATLVTLGVIIVIATIYYLVSQKARVYLEEARDTRNVYMRLLNGLIDGFKELSIHFNKKKQYRDDVEKSTQEFRDKTTVGIVKFINAFMIGESMLVAVLGAVAFAVKRLFPEIQLFTLMSFIMALLYLIGPVNAILNSIPAMVQLRIAWNRVKGFVKDIPANMTPEDIENLKLDIPSVERVEAKGVVFQYESEGDDTPFALGPIDFEANKGEAVFIVGGNGSGKTTFAKILTGLYVPDEGTLKIDGKEVNSYQLGEYFSTVFSGYHLFEKLYNIDLSDENKRKEGEKYIEMLNLQDKVSLEEDSFSTIDLSGGQRKRLALLQCYLEDCPIYLFDEVAADQDPEFRRFFYRELLTRMKEKGKIVIAITHDDHYFDVADRVIKFDMGKLDVLTEGSQYMLSAARQETVS